MHNKFSILIFTQINTIHKVIIQLTKKESNSNALQPIIILLLLFPNQLLPSLSQLHVPILDFLLIPLLSLQYDIPHLIDSDEFTTHRIFPLIGLTAPDYYFLS